MREIARKVWNEQSAALGLLATIALLTRALIAGDALTVAQLVEISAPFAVGLGARRRP